MISDNEASKAYETLKNIVRKEVIVKIVHF
jgi:hypothetical protein